MWKFTFKLQNDSAKLTTKQLVDEQSGAYNIIAIIFTSLLMYYNKD